MVSLFLAQLTSVSRKQVILAVEGQSMSAETVVDLLHQQVHVSLTESVSTPPNPVAVTSATALYVTPLIPVKSNARFKFRVEDPDVLVTYTQLLPTFLYTVKVASIDEVTP